MATTIKQVTRSYGFVEPLLAQLRARQANMHIPSHLRKGRILDIGCGSYPYFLAHTSFKEKFAIDQIPPKSSVIDIQWHTLDLNNHPTLPFDNNYFSAITLLAVVEHLDPQSLISLFQELYRTLIGGGIIFLTTPAAWSSGLLNLLARINFVSEEEIKEHVFAYTLPLLGWYFGRAGFSMNKIRFGYFEMWLNLWALAEK